MSTVEQKVPTTIYAERNPNPDTMSFVANWAILEEGSVEYTDPDQTENSPLAQRLFSFPFVTNIFITRNFITITKNNMIEWDDVVMDLREYILDYLGKGKAVFNKPVVTETPVDGFVDEGAYKKVDPSTDIEKQIVDILDEYITPAVANDGGDIHFHSFNEQTGVLSVVLKGACSGCPSSTATLKNGIETLMTRMLPVVKEVVSID